MNIRRFCLTALAAMAIAAPAAAQRPPSLAGELSDIIGTVCDKLQSPASGIKCWRDRFYYTMQLAIVELKLHAARGYAIVGEPDRAAQILAEVKPLAEEIYTEVILRLKGYQSLPQKQSRF